MSRYPAGRRAGVVGRYLVTGGASFTVDFAVLIALHSGAGAPLGLSVVCAYLVSAAVNYLLLRLWVFTPVEARAEIGRARQFALLMLANLAANFMIVTSLSSFGLDYRLAKAVSVATLATCNYLIASRVVMA